MTFYCNKALFEFLIDLDPQGNLSTGLGVEVADDQISSYDVITEKAEILDAVVCTQSGLNLLPTALVRLLEQVDVDRQAVVSALVERQKSRDKVSKVKE